MPSSDKANRRRKGGGGGGKEEKSFRPKLSDFKRKTGEGRDKSSLPHLRSMDNMRRRERGVQIQHGVIIESQIEENR